MPRKPIAKAAAVERNIETSLDKLETACVAGDKAVAARSRDAKKLTTATRRLAKRKAALTKRKQVATRRVKRAPSAQSRRELRTVVKDLTTTKKELIKTRAVKATNATELASLKVAQRRANAFYKAIEKAERVLNKPKRRRRRS